MDKLFNTESGFKDALIGVYMQMAEPSLYGRSMNITFMDVIAQQYSIKVENSFSNAAKYEYTGSYCKSYIDGFWNNMYKAIANLNAIIGEIDKRKDVLHPTAYGYIKGEALGLRAFLHFDLLRMFGPGAIGERPDMLNKPSIPYVTMYDKGLTKQSTVEEVLKLIEADLIASEKLLAYYDIYNVVSKDPDFSLPSDLFFTTSRRSRFSYIAVKATQARMYMWWGKYDEALACTEGFTTKTNPHVGWVDINRDIITSDGAKDFKLLTEQIFRLDVYKFYENIKSYTEYYKIESQFSSSNNLNYFFHSQAYAEELFEASTVGAADFRFAYMYNKDIQDYTFLKYFENSSTGKDARNKMGLIKKPEMFYIAAECHMRKGENDKAVALLNETRVSRGILYSHNLPLSLTPDQIKVEIEKEYRKEFIGEGVMFFYYKRLNEAIPNSLNSAEDKIFIFPLPATEVEVGNRIEIVENVNN